MTHASFCELSCTGLIAAQGPDAAAFLHAQLTSDVAGLALSHTQYSGYCSPKGRLLATFLVWRLPETLFLQLPGPLLEPILARLAKYVMRAKVTLADATASWTAFGLFGPDAATLAARLTAPASLEVHAVHAAPDLAITRLAGARFLVLAGAAQARAVREVLRNSAEETPEDAWLRLDIEAGIPWITPDTQDEFIPQMVNLDLIDAVSYSKGCYPGQEIVARTHYLGRLKQRMYRIGVAGERAPRPGEPLYSALFGGEQASGSIVNVAPHPSGGYEALAVVQTKSVEAGSVHWNAPHGPAVTWLALPYPIPD